MAWQSKVLELCKKYGGAAKFAAKTILGAVIPGSPAVIDLVEQAFDAAQKSAQDEWEMNLSKSIQTTAENQVRLEEMLDVLGGELQYLFAQMASLEQMPDLAQQMLAVARANDARCLEAVQKLDFIASRFSRLEEQNSQILRNQQRTVQQGEEVLTLVRKISGSGYAKATMKPRLVSGSGGRCDESQWQGICPACDQERLFNFKAFLNSGSFLKSFSRTVAEMFSPASFARGLSSSNAVTKMGCENCGHVMWICANCGMAFSVDPNACGAECANCGTLNG